MTGFKGWVCSKPLQAKLVVYDAFPRSSTYELVDTVEREVGADGRTRTGDMTLTKRLLYQLSYIGEITTDSNRWPIEFQFRKPSAQHELASSFSPEVRSRAGIILE